MHVPIPVYITVRESIVVDKMYRSCLISFVRYDTCVDLIIWRW